MNLLILLFLLLVVSRETIQSKSLLRYKLLMDVSYGKLLWRFGSSVASKLLLTSASYVDGRRMRAGSGMEDSRFDGVTNMSREDKTNLSTYIYMVVMEVLYDKKRLDCRLTMDIPGVPRKT